MLGFPLLKGEIQMPSPLLSYPWSLKAEIFFCSSKTPASTHWHCSWNTNYKRDLCSSHAEQIISSLSYPRYLRRIGRRVLEWMQEWVSECSKSNYFKKHIYVGVSTGGGNAPRSPGGRGHLGSNEVPCRVKWSSWNLSILLVTLLLYVILLNLP